MEGLDCVYRKVLPASGVRAARDGMRDVISRLGRADIYSDLEELRNSIAHGSSSLSQAIVTARDHIELARKALVMMILRIIETDENVITFIVSQTSYKGKVVSHVRLNATIRFDPVGVDEFDTQPIVEVRLDGKSFTTTDHAIVFKPDIYFSPINLKEMSFRNFEYWGDPGLQSNWITWVLD